MDDLKLNSDATEMSGIQRDAGTNIPIVLKRTTEPAAIIDLKAAAYAPRPGSDLQGYWKGTWETPSGPTPVIAKIAQTPTGMFRVQWDTGQPNKHVFSEMCKSATPTLFCSRS